MKISVEIIYKFSTWRKHKFINKTLVKKLVGSILARYPNISIVREVELSLLLTHNADMLDLNSRFRDTKKPTNVLSFPDQEIDYTHLLEFPFDNDYIYLGDIAFGYETIENEALIQMKSFHDHFSHLLVHSVLHMIGYDHKNDEEAKIMENLEIEILKDFSIASPY